MPTPKRSNRARTSSLDRTTTEVRLSNGAVVYVRRDPRSPAPEGIPSFSDVANVIEGMGTDLKAALQKAAPTKATVEVDLSLEYGTGGLLALFGSAKGTGDLKVTFEWDRSAQAAPKGP